MQKMAIFAPEQFNQCKMKRILLLSLFFTLSFTLLTAQERHKIAFYNIENFFDLIDDPDVRDEEFTPDGAKKWNKDKYDKKLKNVEQVLHDISKVENVHPAVIGFCEVENRSVLEDIIATPKLLSANYKITHTDSPDGRGIDCAFIYRPDIFKKIGEKAHTTIIPNNPNYKTRDIMTMWGTIEGDSVMFIVIHWPSRYGGQERSAPLRVAVGEQMHAIIDSVQNVSPNMKFVIMGDFNDDPHDKSIIDALGVENDINKVKEGGLYSPFGEIHKAGYGTLMYRGKWNLFDNIIVSANMLEGSSGVVLQKQKGSKYYGNILNKRYLIQKKGEYKGYPFRTFGGNSFLGGYSDHLPVYIIIGR